jgi:hypothetical protein
VGAPPAINWDAYKEALPHLDVDAIRADYEAFLKTIPDVPYDAKADADKTQADAAVFDGISAYAEGRASELAELQAEQKDHKLHDYYTVARLFQRFDGLYEKEWLEFRRVNLVGNLRSLSEVSESLSEEQKREVVASMADRLGVDASKLGKSQ